MKQKHNISKLDFDNIAKKGYITAKLHHSVYTKERTNLVTYNRLLDWKEEI